MQLPSKTVKSDTKITIKRTLPVPGQVLVQPGQQVQALQAVARAEIPHRYRVINLARQLARSEIDMSRVMLKPVGAYVEADEPIALIKGKLPFVQRTVRAPVAGHLATIGPGWVLLETERTMAQVQAFVNGVVSDIIPGREVIIEARGAVIEAACGFGGEAYGRLKLLVNSPLESIEVTVLDERVAQAVIVVGRSINEALLRRAEALHVRGIIVGSIDASLLNLAPPTKVRVVATEGFGRIPMAPPTFSLLTALQGRAVSIRGQTPPLDFPTHQITESAAPIIIATTIHGNTPRNLSQLATEQIGGDIEVGAPVRITRGPRFGAIGQVEAIPAEPQRTEVGIVAQGAYVLIEGISHYIPWANLERVN